MNDLKNIAINNFPTYYNFTANNDLITYTIRVYNEGNVKGYATEISDDIPDGLVFLPEHKINKDYDWVLNILKDKGLTLKTTGVMTVDYSGKIYLQGLKGRYFAFNVSMKDDHGESLLC